MCSIKNETKTRIKQQHNKSRKKVSRELKSYWVNGFFLKFQANNILFFLSFCMHIHFACSLLYNGYFAHLFATMRTSRYKKEIQLNFPKVVLVSWFILQSRHLERHISLSYIFFFAAHFKLIKNWIFSRNNFHWNWKFEKIIFFMEIRSSHVKEKIRQRKESISLRKPV